MFRFKSLLFPLSILGLILILGLSPDFTEIAAGIALFLFGMFCLEEGFKTLTGGPLASILKHSTNRLWKSLSFGFVSTTLMQSSSLVSLITLSFVSTQMITLYSGIGIIMGSNLGTTTGAWLIAGLGLKVDIAAYALPVLVLGVAFHLQKNAQIKAIGYLLLGFAFLFLGIHYMKAGFDSFQNSVDLTHYALTGIQGLLVYSLIGVLLTLIMQSSHATLLIIISALSAQQISYENALALAIGANLGSTITILLGSLAANAEGKRLAASHVIFNVITAIVAMIIIQPLATLVDILAEYMRIAADNYLLKLALFHSMFNALGILLLSPWLRPLADFLIRAIPVQVPQASKPKFLHKNALQTSATTVNAVHSEVLHLFDNAFGLLAHGLSLRRSTLDSSESLWDAIKHTKRIFAIDVDDTYEAKIKHLHNEIVDFIAIALSKETTQIATEDLYQLRKASQEIVNAVKAMKHLHKNLRRYGLSQHAEVRERYDQIRLQLANLLRTLRTLLRNDDTQFPTEYFQQLLVEFNEDSHTMMLELDELIRRKQISTAIVTSLMNDQAYAESICHSLITTADVLKHQKHSD